MIRHSQHRFLDGFGRIMNFWWIYFLRSWENIENSRRYDDFCQGGRNKHEWFLSLFIRFSMGKSLTISTSVWYPFKETPHICVTGKSEFFMIWEVFLEWFLSMLRKNIFRRNKFERFHKNIFQSRGDFHSIALLKMENRWVEMILSFHGKVGFFYMVASREYHWLNVNSVTQRVPGVTQRVPGHLKGSPSI